MRVFRLLFLSPLLQLGQIFVIMPSVTFLFSFILSILMRHFDLLTAISYFSGVIY